MRVRRVRHSSSSLLLSLSLPLRNRTQSNDNDRDQLMYQCWWNARKEEEKGKLQMTEQWLKCEYCCQQV